MLGRVIGIVVLVAVVLVGVLPVRGADSAAEVQLQRALDSTIDLTIDTQELSKALEAIAGAAKISMQVDPACYEALPYGQTTKVSAKFRASPVRAALDEILLSLGLEQAVSGNNLIIRPSRALMYIGRKASWEELKLLKDLRGQQLPKVDVEWTNDLRTLLGRPELIVKMDAVEAGVQDKAMAKVRAALPCSVAQALDIYTAATGQIWTLQDDSIVVMGPQKWIAGQLERPIVIHFTNAPLAAVIAELGHLSRIHFQPEPGLYLVIPKVSLDSQDGTVQATLDALSGATGISYEVRDEGILLRKPGSLPPAAAAARSDNIIGRVGVPMGKDLMIDLFIREADLPPEVNELRKKRMAEVTAALQAALGSGAATSTAPATRP